MDYKIGDEVKFYETSSNKIMEVLEMRGTIIKVNKKTYKIKYNYNHLKTSDPMVRMPLYSELWGQEKLIKKHLVISNTQPHNNEDH